MDTVEHVPMYKIVLMMGASIAVSVTVTWALLTHHEARPHTDAITREELQTFLAENKEWQRQQTEVLKNMIEFMYSNNRRN